MKLREQYLKDLRKGLEKAKYKDVDAIIEKYQKRFDLAEEAGFKDEESIEKFGSVEDVVESLTGATIIEKSNLSIKEEHKGQAINFKVDLINDDLEIEVGDYDDFEINYKNTEKDRYRVINDNNSYTFEAKKMSGIKSLFGLNNFKHGTIKIFVPRRFRFNEITLQTISGNQRINMLFAKKVTLYTTSGDFNIGKIEADEVDARLVSGDIDIDEINAQNFKVDVVSGDVKIVEAYVKKVGLNSVSGDLIISKGDVKEVRYDSVSGECRIGDKKYKRSFFSTSIEME